MRTFTGREFGWGGTSVKIHHRCPMTISVRSETSRRPKREKLVLSRTQEAYEIVKAWPIDPFGNRCMG